MRYFLIVQMAEGLEWKSTVIPPRAPEAPENSYQSLRDLALHTAARPFCFFVNVTWNTWPALSVLSVYFCVEMNESLILVSYRNALCETTDALP